LMLLAAAEVRAGDFEKAERSDLQAIAIGSRLGHRRALLGALHSRAHAGLFRGEYAAAQKWCERACDVLGELGDGAFTPIEVFFTLGLIQAQRGEVGAAFATFEAASARAAQYGQQHTLARIASGRAWLERELGLFTHSSLDALTECAIETRVDQLVFEADGASRSGDFARAQESLQRAADLIDAPGPNAARCHVRRCLLRLEVARCVLLERAEEHDQLVLRARSLETLAARDGARRYMALAHGFIAEAAARCGDAAEAERELRAGLALFDTEPAPLLTWKLWAKLGRVLGAGSPAGELAYRRAHETVRGIAGRCDAELATQISSSPLVRELIPIRP
jgi:hypothetical protein